MFRAINANRKNQKSFLGFLVGFLGIVELGFS